jgi:hypothetical protein
MIYAKFVNYFLLAVNLSVNLTAGLEKGANFRANIAPVVTKT